MRLNFFTRIIMSEVIERQRVVITGIGTVTSYGDGVEALRRILPSQAGGAKTAAALVVACDL